MFACSLRSAPSRAHCVHFSAFVCRDAHDLDPANQAQDLKNADGFMGKMTGNVSDPFCEIYMRDYRQNTQASIAEWKVLRASQLAVLQSAVLESNVCFSRRVQRVGRTELVKNKLNVKFKRSVVVECANNTTRINLQLGSQTRFRYAPLAAGGLLIRQEIEVSALDGGERLLCQRDLLLLFCC